MSAGGASQSGADDMQSSYNVSQKKGEKSWLAATWIDNDSHIRNRLIANRDGELGCSGSLAAGWRCLGRRWSSSGSLIVKILVTEIGCPTSTDLVRIK
jgi:hypothetical protein